MILFSKKNTYCLAEGNFREVSGDVANPGRGWYRIYTYTLGRGESCDLPPVLYGGETLALVVIDIGAYREEGIPEEGLALIGRVLAAFAGAQVDMLLRIVYDTSGKGMEHEPSFFSQVLGHIAQLGPLLREYGAHILVFQGVLVGSWGEMHTSKFVTNKYLRQLTEAILRETGGGIKIAFRTPTHLRRIAAQGSSLWEAVGFFDDAMLADETHLGTFGQQSREEVGWENPWRPEEELAFLEEASRRVPFGGEVLKGASPLSAGETVKQLHKLHVSYLNCTHDAVCLEQWRNTPVKDEPGGAGYDSLYEYVGAHLGYRFLVMEAGIIRKGKEYRLDLLIANKGFACCPRELELSLYTAAPQGTGAGGTGAEEKATVVPMPGGLQGGEQAYCSIPLEPGELREGNAFFIALREKASGRTLRFANEGAGERLFLGRLNRQ